jgi:hypothetical protein
MLVLMMAENGNMETEAEPSEILLAAKLLYRNSVVSIRRNNART